MRDLHVAFPAQVQAYDSSKQTVDVKPLLADPYLEDDDTVTQVLPAVINSVPLVFPGAGGFRLTFPVNVGDTVLCVIADRSIDAWSNQGGPQEPSDLRKHNRSDAIAIPGLHADNASWSGASTSAITIGKDGGTDDAVALASKVDTRLNDLKTALNSWSPITGDGGAALKTALTTWLAGTSNVGSASVKIKE